MAVRNVETFFDAYAEGFDAIYGTQHTFFNRMINKHFRKCMRIRFEKTLAGCLPIEGRRVLDIGCGPGHYGIHLAEQGAGLVYGIDFAEGMISLAEGRAQAQGVSDRCQFVLGDFLAHRFDGLFDYAVVMGFMDYVEDPKAVVEKVLSLTTSRAFFSFPMAGGFLAWQRKVRYKQKCDLFLYRLEDVLGLFEGSNCEVEVEDAHRDFFVTVRVPESRNGGL